MSAHAVLGPSSAHRWLACPGSVKLSGQAPPQEAGRAAEVGTYAHAVGERKAARLLGLDDPGEPDHRPYLDHDEQAELDRHTDAYAEFVWSLSQTHDVVMLEQRVWTGIEGCWGTADVVALAEDTITILDLKYGIHPVQVSDNPQLKLYALGALATFNWFSRFKRVRTVIYQPRLGVIEDKIYTIGYLSTWRDQIAPIAAEALAGSDRFNPSADSCRWCPARGICRARKESLMDSLTTDVPVNELSDDDLAHLISIKDEITSWLKDVAEAARAKALAGHLPGWKAVSRPGRRYIAKPDQLIHRLTEDEGIPLSQVAEMQPKTMTYLSRLLGKDRFEELAAPYLDHHPDTVAVVPESAKGTPLLDTMLTQLSDLEDL